jgi:hypothetical protein
VAIWPTPKLCSSKLVAVSRDAAAAVGAVTPEILRGRKQFIFWKTFLLGMDRDDDSRLPGELVLGYLESRPYGQHARLTKLVQISLDRLINGLRSRCGFRWHKSTLSVRRYRYPCQSLGAKGSAALKKSLQSLADVCTRFSLHQAVRACRDLSQVCSTRSAARGRGGAHFRRSAATSRAASVRSQVPPFSRDTCYQRA